MAELQVEQPKSLIRPKSWSAEVENAYRYQLAGYRDEKEYKALTRTEVNFLCFKAFSLTRYYKTNKSFNRLINGQRRDLLKSYKEKRTAISTITTENENVQTKIFQNVKSTFTNLTKRCLNPS
jgi:hypothetical protein